MAANIDPIYTRQGNIGGISAAYMTAANTTADLTSGTIYLLFTADATNGSFVQRIRFRSTPAGATTATVARIWINNGASTGTATNNILFDEISLPVSTNSATSATTGYDLWVNFALPAGYTMYATLGTASANGWRATTIGGDY